MNKRIALSFVLLSLGGLWELLYEFTETDRHGLRYICVSWSVAQPEMKVLHSLGPCADRQRQYQDAPLGWIWPINVDRVHLVSAKEIVCLWLCVCQWVCSFEKCFKDKARTCVFVFYSRSLRGYQTSRPYMCVSHCDVQCRPWVIWCPRQNLRLRPLVSQSISQSIFTHSHRNCMYIYSRFYIF